MILKAKDIDTKVTGRSTGHPVRALRNQMTKEYLKNGKRYGWSECRTCEGADELSGTDQKVGKRDGCVVERNWNL